MTPTPQNIRVVDVAYGQTISGDVITPTLINPYSAMSIPAYFRAMNFIAENLASFPLYVAREDDNGEVEDHPLDDLLERRPNGYQNTIVFWRTLFFHAAHSGNGYARVQRDLGGQTIAVHGYLPEDVVPFRLLRDGQDFPEQWYFVGSRGVAVPGVDMIHIQSLSWDGMWGPDPIALHQATFQRAATIDKYQTRFLLRGTVLKGSVEVPGEMSDEALAQFKAFLRANFSGADANDDLLILTQGAKLNNTTLSPEQSQLVEQAAHTTKQIAQITGVPPEFLFERSESKYSGVTEAGENVVRYCLRPWISQVECELTLKLLTSADQAAGLTIKMDPEALLRGDTKAQTDTIVARSNAGLVTKNEGRIYLGYPKSDDPDADRLKTLGDTAPPKPATAN